MASLSRTRATLATTALLGLASIGGHVVGAGEGSWSPGSFALATVLAIGGALVFVRGHALGAAVLVLILTVGARADISLRHTLMTGADTTLAGGLLAGWLLGWLLLRTERGAHEAACGVLGAALTLAAVAKLRASGLEWVDGPTQALAVYVRGLGAPGPLATLRGWLALHPTLCAVGAAGTLLVESAGVLYAVPRFRGAYAWGVVAMFVGLALGFGAFQPAWVVAALGLARGPTPAAARSTASRS